MAKKFIQQTALAFQQNKSSVPLILLLFSILAFAPLIPFLGFYWDGWPYLWQYHVFGPAGYPEFVASDRPYSAFLFMIITNLFGTKAIYYHIFTLVCRWLSGWAFWWILEQLWPKKRTFNIYAAILFILYPGFLQQPIALPYAHHFSHMALFLFSMGAMLASTRDKKKFSWLTILALIAQLSIFSLEYFASLEFIRPFLLWITLRNENEDRKGRFKQVLRYWSPYLIILVIFYVWRVFFFSFPTYEPKMLNELNQDFSSGFLSLVSQALKDILTVTYGAVKGLFNFPKVSEVGYFSTYGYWGIMVIACIFSTFVLRLIEPREKNVEEHQSTKDYLEPLLMGILALIFAGAIFWITKLTVRIEFAWDRLTLAYMFGVAVLFASLLFLLFHYPKIRIALTTLFITLTVGFHFLNAMDYKHDWDTFKDFFWQLTWRIPDLEENTIILTTDFPLKYYSDNSLTAPLNWTYDPESDDETLSYVFYFSDVRLKVGRLSALEKDLPVHQWYRSFSFDGNTSDTVVIRYDPPGCLQVLDEKYANAGIIPNLTQLEADQIPLSNLDRIITDSDAQHYPPIDIIGEEIDHDWCYYYEKADLARQVADWDAIIALKKQAEQAGVAPRNPSEWLPFFEAYIRTENWEQVRNIIQTSLAVEDKYTMGILFTWDRTITESGVVPDAATLEMINSLRD
ncbi:MAG TPA: hypothetical protein DCK95_10655 [Anaerolineaceae bacterium]|uniref:Putative membrane protein n=1 Tax=Anaerolinea thermophila TaxID=167964 RepID=A0A101FZ40_9CHLR|nr:MAG: putative membrane protein [Anaerolinea thermophila]HAF62768.1 hypothetical protein [Anaerolineaceae bacterium]